MTTTTPPTTPTVGPLTQIGTGSDDVASDVVALSDGGYMVVWDNAAIPVHALLTGQRYDAQGHAEGSAIAFHNGYGTQITPSVVVLPDGELQIAYADTNNNIHPTTWSYDISVDHYDLTSNSSTPPQYEYSTGIEGSANNATDPQIAAFADGGFAVSYTYTFSDGSLGAADTDTYLQLIKADGSWGASVTLNADAINTDSTRVATLSNNTIVAVYDHQGGSIGSHPQGHYLQFDIVNEAGTILHSGNVAGAVPYSGADITQPEIAALKGGGYVVSWTEGAGDGAADGVRAAVFDNNGGQVGTAFTVNTTTAGDQDFSGVTALSDGGFLVNWNDEQANLVRGQRYDAAGHAVGTEFTIASGVDTSGAHGALLSNGEVIYTIDEGGPGSAHVYTVMVDPTGTSGGGGGGGSGDAGHGINGTPIVGTDAGETLHALPEGSSLVGLGGDDTLIGSDQEDLLNGGPGHDTMYGGGGDDFFAVYGNEAIGDHIYGGTGDDSIVALDGTSVVLSSFNAAASSLEQWTGNGLAILGTDGNDVLSFAGMGMYNVPEIDGGAGNDVIIGSDSNDVIVGGQGADTLMGGLGADRFVFNSVLDSLPGAGHDVILDFHHAEGDKIDLSGIDANAHKAGNQAFHLVNAHNPSQSLSAYDHSHAHAQWAGALRVTKAGLVQGDINGDGHVDFEIKVVGGAHLTAHDFIL